jgi:hypothetical protein
MFNDGLYSARRILRVLYPEPSFAIQVKTSHVIDALE